MLSSRWTKILNDLWRHKTRTALIVLSIAVGLFAVGTIVSSRTILSTEMDASYAAIHPSNGTIRTVEPFDEAFVRSVQAMDGVAEADARRVIDARVEVGPGEWVNLTLFAIEDYDRMRVNVIWPHSGAWPPPEREILIERAALPVIRSQVGGVVRVETPDEKQHMLPIAGTVHDLAQLPAQFDNSPYGYISFDTLEWFGEPHGFNELHVLARNVEDKARAQQVVNAVKDRAERCGHTIPLTLTADPGQLPLDDILQAILLLMGVLGALALALSAFLIVNTVSALLVQQRRQIGVMKALGARTVQVVGMYLAMVVLYGFVALLIAVPLSIAGSRALSRYMASMFNFDLTQLRVPPRAILLQAVTGLVTPALASLPPFLANLRFTPAQAMSAHQMGRGRFGTGLLDRLLSGANLWFVRRVLMRPVILSVRNTFRSKGRLALTLVTLTLASAIFVSVSSVRASLFRTVDDLLASWNFDAIITFARPYRVARIEGQALSMPGVLEVDTWIQVPGRRVRADGSESGPIYLFAPRADSTLSTAPTMVEGRWLLPGDDHAIVVNTNLLREEPDIALGDEITLKVGGKERPWRVVGVSKGVLVPMAYGNYPYVARLTGRVGRADAAQLVTECHDRACVSRAAAALETHFERNGLRVSNVQTVAAERAEAQVTYGIVVALMLVMACMLAVVGGLGLMGTMSINVLERRREIGVLRAVGAPNRGVERVFILESVIIGLLSWLLGGALALPMGKLLSDAVGVPLSGAPLSFSYSLTGLGFWLIAVVVLSVLASSLPARNASRLTVREVLAYE